MLYYIIKIYLRLLKWVEDIFFGGPLFLNRMGKYFREMIYEGNITLQGIGAFCWYLFVFVGCPTFFPKHNNVSTILSTITLIILFFISVYDLNVMEAFWVGYKKSDYYLATGNKRRKIWFDKGLQGEFMAYVLSRELKMEHRTLYNVCVPMENGNFQEIDAIIITNNMIYVLECKNRAGRFEGTYEDEKWKQYIGKTINECSNIYMQNQKHTMAIDQLLLKHGIIDNGQSVCMNYVVIAGVATLPTENLPIDFSFGARADIAKYINETETLISSENGGGSDGIMQQVYELLLPYALYTNEERKSMMQARERIAKNSNDFALGKFKVVRIPEGISGISEAGEETIIRRNRIYTQVLLVDGSKSCWQTRTDIPSEYFN